MGAPTNIWYSNIASVAAGNVNVLADLVDPNLSATRVKLVTAIYTMTGNEVANDVIYLARLPSGAIVDPDFGSMAGNGIATTATVGIGDTDTQGGTVAYDPFRYSAAQNVAAAVTTTAGVAIAGGTTIANPPVNPQATAALAGMTGFSGVSGAALVSYGITDDWVWLLATFATLTVPVSGKQIVFRIRVATLD